MPSFSSLSFFSFDSVIFSFPFFFFISSCFALPLLSPYFYTSFVPPTVDLSSSLGFISICMRASPERLLILAPFPSRDCNLRFRYARRLGHPRGGTLPTYLPLAYVPNEIHLYSISNRALFPCYRSLYNCSIYRRISFICKSEDLSFCPHDLPIFLHVASMSLNFFHAAFFCARQFY